MRTLLLIIILFAAMYTNAQIGISDSFYKVLLPQLQPNNRLSLSLEELQNIMSHASSLPYETFQPDISLIANKLSKYADDEDHNITNRIKSLKAILSFYWDLSAGDSLLKYSGQLLKIAGDNSSFKADIAYAQISKSVAFSSSEKYHEAIAQVQLAEQNLRGLKTDSLLLSAFYNAYSLPYYYLNIYDKAIYYGNLSLVWCPVKEKWQIPGTQSMLTLALLRVYLLSKDPDKNQKQGDTALQLVDIVMTHEKANAPFWFQACYFTKGFINFSRREYAAAIANFDLSMLPAYSNVSRYFPNNYYYTKLLKAASLIKLGRLKEGKTILNEIQNIRKVRKEQLIMLDALCDYAVKTNDFKSAYDYQVQIKRCADSINIERQASEVFELEQKYLVTKKEALITQITQEKRQQHLLITALLVVLVLLVIIFYLVYRSNKRKLETSIQRVNNMTELQIFKIEEAVAKAKEQERIELGAELHNNIASTLSATTIFLNRKSRLETDASEKPLWNMLSEALSEMYEQIRNKSHDLFGSGKNADLFIEELKKNIQLFFSGTSMQTDIEIDDLELNQISPESKVCLLHVIKEGITNILKYANADKVHMLMYTDTGKVYFSLTDNGQGISSNNRRRTGIGLNSIKQKVEVIKGSFKITSSKNGTTINVVLPFEQNY